MAVRKVFGKMEPCSSAPNMCMTSPAPGFAAGYLDNSRGHSRREPLIPSSRSQPFAESLASFLNRVSYIVSFSLISDNLI